MRRGGSANQYRAAAAHGVAQGDTLTVDIHALAGGTGKGAGAGVAKVDGLAAQWVPPPATPCAPRRRRRAAAPPLQPHHQMLA